MGKRPAVLVILVLGALIGVKLWKHLPDKMIKEESPRMDALSDANPPQTSFHSLTTKHKDTTFPGMVDAKGPVPSCLPDFDLPESYDVEKSIAILSQSDNPEHKLAAALMHPTTDQNRPNLSLLSSAYHANPSNPIVLWNLYVTCRQRGESFCKSHNWEKLLIASDGQNSEVWAAVANYRYQENDTQGALQALQKVVNSPITNNYFVEYVQTIERSLAASSNLSYTYRLISGIGFAAAKVPPSGKLYYACRDESEVSPHWLRLCLAYGEHQEKRTDTFMAQFIGLGLQEKMLTILGDRSKLKKTQRRHQRLKALMREHIDVSNYMLADDLLAAQYFEEWSTRGELAAMKYIAAKYKELSKEERDALCE